MGPAKLKKDLYNCLINFDRRVLITELLDEYKCAYEEVNQIVQNYLVEQETKDNTKFEKRFLIHGVEDDEKRREIYQIVEEAMLKECLQKVTGADSSLYSVEVAGGAKSPAPIFKPMSIEECVRRQGSKTSVDKSIVASTSSEDKSIVREEDKKNVFKKESPKKISISTESALKKNSPKNETTRKEKKSIESKPVVKKGINNFFSPSTAAAFKKTDNSKDSKTASDTSKTTTTPLNKPDKQVEEPKVNTDTLKKCNTSLQLFEEDEPEEEEDSSDEEEKLEALKRDIISSDVEIENEENGKSPCSKRRRILDSDDEKEDPPNKQEKTESVDAVDNKEGQPVAETYLDEDGFVITKKPKHKATSTAKKSPANLKTPPVTMKKSLNETKSKPSVTKSTKAATSFAVKTKQAGIRNFFSKK